MTAEILVYRLLARALLDIRIASLGNESKVVFALSDAFHNIPYQLETISNQGGDFSEIIAWLEERCAQKGMAGWLQNAVANIQENESS
jgi:hypothetical protein